MDTVSNLLKVKCVCSKCCGAMCFFFDAASTQWMGAVVQLVEYRTHNQDVAGSTHTRSTASNLEQVANLLCAQANSASYSQWTGNE